MYLCGSGGGGQPLKMNVRNKTEYYMLRISGRRRLGCIGVVGITGLKTS